MSKELEVLEKIKFIVIWENGEYRILNSLFRKEIKLIETALKKYEVLQEVHKDFVDKNIKKLKALEIIKEKKVNVGNFIYWLKQKPRTYEDYLKDFYQEQWYLHYKDNNDNRCKFHKLTQKEFDLLKEVLL